MQHAKVLITAVLSALIMVGAGARAFAQNDRFKEVLSRGEIRIGVHAALKPWSYRDPNGNLVGLEVDLAREVAETLGVKLELVAIESSNRMQFLQQKKIDLIIGGMGDTPDRRKVVGMVEPHYFASGANVLARKNALKDWSDLKDKPVCAKQGVFYGKLVEQETGAKLVSFIGNTEALQALRSGKCVAFLTDDSNVSLLLATGEWPDWEMPFKTRYGNTWAVGVPLEELNGIWGRFMSGMVYKWHATGKLIELQKKWGFKPTQWFVDMEEKLKKDDL
ncbi:transporter substrate-binding domain-containing protein [Pseudorhodoplanes sp.]|jgi:polar amino acid transport system substrate-binding protein|uniref:transporter substrate-binding domain-containing protein n=1 Tax=Pseudorhodoplanes sp. TaxID=1934341 RepID=UPI003D121AD7